ncbi:MAG: glycosyltransferase family 2 protein [Actinomycetota bacterium]|nr:glycosyltransferase family 2 protein [Actinomycetota bacterium]
MPDIELSVVVPVFDEADNIPAFMARLLPLLRRHVRSYEVVFAADPSRDGTEDVIRRLREEDPAIKLIIFSRRFGQPTATLAGIEYASGNAVVVMDVDLQDPPELVPEMLARWREGFEVVYAQRRDRSGETRVKKLVASLGYRLINRFSDVPIPRDTGDFRLMDRRVVDELLRFPETHGFLRGMVALVGFRQTAVMFDRDVRHAGRGHYNRFLGSVRIGLNGLIAFSSALLNLSTAVGFAAAGAAFLVGIAYLIATLAGVQFPVGNPTIVALVLFVGGVQLICIGIIGQYLGRIYDEVKRRPRYIVDVAEGFVEPGSGRSTARAPRRSVPAAERS